MARKKKITDDELITMLDKYFIDECENDTTKLKITQFGRYLRTHGYPDVDDYLIRRSSPFRERMESLKEKQDFIVKAAVFQPLNVNAFLSKNATPDKLKKALSTLDSYYESVSKSCGYYMDKSKKLTEQLNDMTAQYQEALITIEKLQSSCKELKAQLAASKEDVKQMQSYIESYVNPDIAAMLLQEGNTKIAKATPSKMINEDAAKDQILRANKPNKFTNTVIQGLFDPFDDSK